MSDPKKHHHVAQFLLSGWCGADTRLAVYSRKAGRLVIDRHTPEHTGYEPYLYSLPRRLGGDPQWVEREIFAKVVDEPASRVHKRLLAGELSKLDAQERSDWARFIHAQWIRSPEGIAKLKHLGREIMQAEIDCDHAGYLAVKGSAPQSTLREYVESHEGFYENVILGRFLPRVIDSEGLGSIIINMHWEVLDLSLSDVDLLTSDRPVMRYLGLKDQNCT